MELIAKPIFERRRLSGIGLESLLDVGAVAVLVIGNLSAIGLLFVGGISALMPAVLLSLGAWLNWLLFRTLAEIVRLLKRVNRLDFAGRISGSHIDTVATCSNCGSILRSDVCCNACGARLVTPDEGGDHDQD